MVVQQHHHHIRQHHLGDDVQGCFLGKVSGEVDFREELQHHQMTSSCHLRRNAKVVDGVLVGIFLTLLTSDHEVLHRFVTVECKSMAWSADLSRSSADLRSGVLICHCVAILKISPYKKEHHVSARRFDALNDRASSDDVTSMEVVQDSQEPINCDDVQCNIIDNMEQVITFTVSKRPVT
ncbi:hypothetical protein JHK82_039568 [Glycine max]|nr:hypothetical protein JHK82_039568 [Glycine max]